MVMNYNPSGPWYSCNFYGGPNQFPLPGAPFPRGQFTEQIRVTEGVHNLSSSSQSPEFQYKSSPRRIDLSCESAHESVVLSKAMTLKALSHMY